MNNTLVKHDGYVTAVINQPCLEPGVLHYIVEYQINDSTYPDAHKRIFQEFTSDIELCKGNGDTLDIDVQAMFGDTIDDKFNSYDASILALGTATTALNTSILGITQKNSVQDASINRIEDIISTIDGGTSGSIDRLDTSVNALSRDVSTLNRSVDTLSSEQEIMSQNLSNVTNTVNDVSTRVDGFESAMENKADVSVLSNYYTTGETYTKTEVDTAIANAALDGSLPQGIVIDANYVHTDNNYTNEDKAKVRDFDLTGYPTNSSLVANYATKAELQNVDDNHPSNSSVSNNYVKKNDIDNYLSDYPTNSSVSENYATKAQVSVCIDEDDLAEILTDYPTNSSLSNNYVDWFYANETYVAYENIDEIFYNFLENSQRTENKIDEIVNDSSTIADINTNVSDVSIKVDDVSVKVKDVSLVSLDISTRLLNDYLTSDSINRDYAKNASLNDYVLNSSLSANYTTKDEFNEVWTTFVTADYADETYAKTIDVSNNLTSNDVSAFKPIVFCTQEEYDTLVENDHVDANTVYMINTSTAVNYLTPDDVSNFVTTDDISTFITENDASVYALTSYVDTIDSSIVNYVDTQIGNIQNILQTI